MKDFFKVTDLDRIFEYIPEFPVVDSETISLPDTTDRIVAADIISDVDLPGFERATMDGYAVSAASTFGASGGNPAYLNIKGSVVMGESPDFAIEPGEAAFISTGGMLPGGADSVIMVEHTEQIDETTIEAYKSVAPGGNMVETGEDVARGSVILTRGQKIRPQEAGMLAAFGHKTVAVYKKPIIGIISTGDELCPAGSTPNPGKVRDINTYTLSAMVQKAGGIPLVFGIIKDDFDSLLAICTKALAESDMVLISGGSSVGMRDLTIEVLSSMPDSSILAHGISISPGKPTILAKIGRKAFWGMPGHVVSAMIVFAIVAKPFVEYIGGLASEYGRSWRLPAILRRNISSSQGRTEFVRVRLVEEDGVLWAEPLPGKSTLINTMVKADALIELGLNVEGLDKGSKVSVILL
ncbi:MAG: molybdopterin molybdotransferase MoeA [Deltaproteobacteria bacterium]|nr:molybdopterin molybdotransferase MoeA [Deltaproteobacteria bacterium]